jgi:SAM-dependent methyltransferase
VLTDDEIRLAWLLILGREPESEQVYAAHRHLDLQRLRLILLSSQEFRRSHAKGTRSPGALLLSRNPGPQATARPEVLARMFERIQAQWTALGSREPYWSVLTDDRYRMDRIEESREAFFRTGHADRQLIEASLARNRIAPDPDRVGVELGCGVGRASIRIAPLFRELHAYDISPGNLALAERHAAEAGVRNIRFHLLRSVEDYAGLEGFDFFFSRLVLQHNPPPVQRHMLQQIVAKARPGALLFFQVFTYWTAYGFDAARYLAEPVRDMEVHCLPQSTVFSVLGNGGCRVIEVMEDDCVGTTEGISCTFLARKR